MPGAADGGRWDGGVDLHPRLPMPHLRKPPLTADLFTPTKFRTAADKAWTGNAILAFAASGFRWRSFSKRLYRELSCMYSHIAHNDIHGFFSEWFETAEDTLRFLEHTAWHPGSWMGGGDPGHTSSDVERAVAERLAQGGALAAYRTAIERSARDGAILAEGAAGKGHDAPCGGVRGGPPGRTAPPAMTQTQGMLAL